ncbi:MAG: ABC transporter substrate-binding protein [Sphaerobacter sp.]|nr:ABC transporter substrate-binding protein [Sphaerobacter sp.]
MDRIARSVRRAPAQGYAVVVALLTLTLALAGCVGQADAQPTHEVTIGLGYVPNVQFAPFYVADAMGYYRDAGIRVTFRHHTVGEDLFGAIIAGQEDVIFAAGDETLQARSRGVDLVYVAQVWNRYPVGLIVPADSPIASPADLKGRTVGIPGKFGATYIGLLALLKQAGLTEQDVNIQSIGFTQVPALLDHQVDAVMGYLNNEPIQFEKAAFPVRTFAAADAQPLISNGIVVKADTLDAKADDIRAVIEATLKGVQYTIEHPEEAVDLSKKYVPGLDQEEKAADALAVLEATIPLWQTNGTPGKTDPAAWESMARFLDEIGQLGGPVDASEAFTNDYLPA